MLSEFQEFIKNAGLCLPGERILLAVSGGMDSVAMAALFHKAAYPFGIAHCNFLLRGKESDAEEDFVKSLADHYRVALHLKHFDTKTYAADHGISIQMAARELRYRWFLEIREEFGYHRVATAHHQDDQVESFFINLSRGTGIAGLHGILPKKGPLIRPLMFATRDQIREFIAGEKLEYREDSSNDETKYLRNRLRHIILPEFEKLNPGFRENMLQTIRNIRHAEEIYNEAIRHTREEILETQGEETRIKISLLAGLKPLHTLAYELLNPYGFNARQAEDIVNSLEKESGRLFYSETHRLLIDREFILIAPFGDAAAVGDVQKGSFFITAQSGEMTSPVHLSWQTKDTHSLVMSDDRAVALLDAGRLKFPLEIRRWEQGDSFYPLGMKGKKKVSDFFIDEKLSRFDKERTWLLCSEGEIAWIIGHRIDERFKVTEATINVLEIRLILK